MQVIRKGVVAMTGHINPWTDAVNACIDRRRGEIIAWGEDLYRHPETGYKETESSRIAEEAFRTLGLSLAVFMDIPGVKVTVDTGRPGPGIALMGELDSVVCREHPDADPMTGAVHACGHNVQVAAMLGAAVGLMDSGVLDTLCGKVHFIAVPAEEYIEVAYRAQLREKGIIRYLGGKPELLRRGWFDDVDMAVILHGSAMQEKMDPGFSCNGCIVKKIRYLGKAAHAGGGPHEGINALYAANLGITAINALRETFRDEAHIRVHPIITKGGDIVNVIPSEVTLETFVRGKTLEDIEEANQKVDRALAGAAIAMGAQVEIEDLPGYFPLNPDPTLTEVVLNVMKALVPPEEIGSGGHSMGSTDVGDLSSLMPVVHPNIGGAQGTFHGADYKLTDPDTAYILGAKLLACIVVALLEENGAEAARILANFTPRFTSKEAYFEHADRFFQVKRSIPGHYLK